MRTRDQAYMNRTEVETAIEYAEIAAKYDVPVTLFLTGRTAVEEPERVETLGAMDNVEIGGHNYWAFDTPIHKAWRAVEKVTDGQIGSWNGPRKFQLFEIRRTIKVLNELGADVNAWRDHAYRHDRYTLDLLADVGVTYFSDAVGPDKQIRQENGVTIVPINTPPDHDHIYHAFRTRGSKAAEEFNGPFGSKSVLVDEWVEWVLETIESARFDEEVATILAHPACLWLADELQAFEDIIEAISDKQLCMMSELINITT